MSPDTIGQKVEKVPTSFATSFQVLTTSLLAVLRLMRFITIGRADTASLRQDPGLRRRTFFSAFTMGSRLALVAAGTFSARLALQEGARFPGGLGGYVSAILLSTLLFVFLYVMETMALAQLDFVPDQEILILCRSHFMLGIAIPWTIGSLMVFLASSI